MRAKDAVSISSEIIGVRMHRSKSAHHRTTDGAHAVRVVRSEKDAASMPAADDAFDVIVDDSCFVTGTLQCTEDAALAEIAERV